MSEKKFSKQHEWVSIDGDVATIGITKHASEMLGDVVFVELPDKNKSIEKDSQAGVVESTKAASDIYAPVSGEIIEVNKELTNTPQLVNTNPEDSGWYIKIKLEKTDELNNLLSFDQYKKIIQ